jgi:subtilisin-like proprotein convertase family protein
MKTQPATHNLTNETAATQKRIETVPLRATTNNHNTMKTMKAKILLVLLAAVSPLLLQAQTTESFTFTTNRLVPDGDLSGLSDVRMINTAVGNISSLQVRLKVTGEFNGDLYAYLRNTNGFVVLLNRVGKTVANPYGYGDSGFNVTFQAGAANGDIHTYQNVTNPAAGAPLFGIWQPDGRTNDPATVTDLSARTTTLTNFNGFNGAGQWTLFIADVESGGTNMLTEWGLDISGAASPTLAWTNPADITYGTALGGTQLNATATYSSTNVPGTFTYSSPAGTVLSAGGSQAISVTFTPNDTNSFLPVTTSVAINVSPAPLIITANNTNTIYGAALPAFTASYSGFVNGDTTNSLTTQVTLGTAATSASPVGAYAITATGAADANYNISYVNGTLTVNPAALTITANNTNTVYGAALPVFTASYSGFVNGDTASSLTTPVNLGTSASASSPAGVYTITASGAVDANYTISFVNGTLSVNPAVLTITANDTNKLYGAALPAFTASYSGFVNGDTTNSLTTQVTLGTAASASSPVGAYAITASGAADANYTIGFVNGTLTINPAALTITANDTNKVYGAALPAFTASYSGFVNGDTTNSLTTQVTLGTAASASSPVGAYAITSSGAADTNYNISFVNGTLTINPAALTITANNTNKVYGAALPAFTASYSGFVNGDTTNSLTTQVTLGTAASASSPVGAYAITASGAADTNYNISFVNGTLTVNPAALTITANNTNTVYGAALPAFTASYSGFVNGDTTNSLTTQVTLATSATSASPAGAYAITASGAADTNYSISFVNGTLTVGTATLTVTADNQTKAYGQALPVLTASYSGFVNGDTTNSLATLAVLATTATSVSNVGVYPITASGAVSTNYAFAYVAGALTITNSLSFGAIVSSANPALPGTNVTFTMTLGAVAPGAGTPTGTVNFRIDGSILGSGTLAGGVATFTTNNLAHGVHTVAAEYAGDGNFIGTTNALAQNQIINTPPVAGNVTITRNPALSVKVQLATLLANASDADGDTLSISVSSLSASNATITVSGGWVFYTPPAGFTNADSFTYTVTDGYGGSATGTVTVAVPVDNSQSQNLTITALGGGSYLINGSGIPGYTYHLQYSDTMGPFNWQTIESVTANSIGAFQYTDTTGSPMRFYRTVYP